MSIRINSCTITPNELTIGKSFFISVNVEEIKWSNVKNELKSWNDVKNSFTNWGTVKNFLKESD